MLSQFSGKESSQLALQNKIKEDLNSALIPLIQKYAGKIDGSQQKALLNHIQELFFQKVLVEDAGIQMDRKDKSDEISSRQRALLDKWKQLDDTEETRKILGVYGVQTQLLHNSYSSMLIDDLKSFKETWEESQNHWKSMLEMACLLGSSQIGNFIFGNKAEKLSEENCGQLLCYIALSSNNDWALAFAEKMKDKHYKFPDNLYAYAIDLDFVQDIQEVFKSTSKKITM